MFVGGAVSFTGWAFGIDRLIDWTGSGLTMKTNTTLLTMASGIALFAYALSTRLRAITGVIGAAVAGGAFLTLLQHLMHVDFGIDNLLFTEAPGSPATVSPNRMGPPASTCFTLLGLSLCLLASHARGRRLAVVVATLVFALGVLSLTGHWYHAEAIYTLPQYTAIAAQTAALLVLLSVGIIAALPEYEPSRTIFADDTAGALVRRMLPFLVGVPLVLGWLRLEGQRRGLYDSAFGTALRTWVEVAILAALTWWATRAIRRREAAQALAEAALREADRRKDAFLATLSHELRNPLAPIRNSANILMLKGPLPPPLQWAVEVIERQVRHMTRLLDDLLDVSRITRDRLELRRAPLDVNIAVRAALEASRPRDRRGATRAHRRPRAPDPLRVDGDVDRLSQVFSNLLNNARQVHARGRTSVDLDAARGRTGGDPRARRRYRHRRAGDAAHLRDVRAGARVGGAVAGRARHRPRSRAAIVELHGGRLDGRSDGKDRGSEFTVRLPALDA